jgi:hypothetical protein
MRRHPQLPNRSAKRPPVRPPTPKIVRPDRRMPKHHRGGR